MAAAVATITLTDERNSFSTGNKYFALGVVSISADPATYTTGGIACSLAIPLVKASRAPQGAIVQGLGAGTTGTLFEYRYVPGVNASSGLLKIFTSNGAAAAGLAEFPNATAIPADVSGDLIVIAAMFVGQC